MLILTHDMPLPTHGMSVVLCRGAADDVVLSGCTLELPPAEYERLAHLAETGSGQVVLKLSSEYERAFSTAQMPRTVCVGVCSL
jgi:hypothetical protein